MADSFELPDETERLQVNLEDDVRAFLMARLTGNQMDPQTRARLIETGVDVRRLSKPSYLSVNSGCDGTSEDGSARGCRTGAEGVMIHEDEAAVHLAFKCGIASHEMHYTTFMPVSIIEMAKAMEAVWPGSILGPMMEQAARLKRTGPLAELLDTAESALEEDDEDSGEIEFDFPEEMEDDEEDSDLFF